MEHRQQEKQAAKHANPGAVETPKSEENSRENE